MDHLVNEARPAMSAITEIELLCWKSATPKDIEVLRNFIQDSVVIELEQPIKFKTVIYEKRIKLNFRMQIFTKKKKNAATQQYLFVCYNFLT